MSTAQRPHALSVPEVLFEIARYLETINDLIACSLVCKNFHAAFEPYIWTNIHLGRPPTLGRWRERHQEPLTRFVNLKPRHGDVHQKELGHTTRQERILQGLQRIAPWIRSLAVRGHSFPRQWRLGDQCTEINALLITGVPCNDRLDETYWSDCEALLKQNSRSLRSLTLVRWMEHCDTPNPGQPLCRPLLACAQHANLTTLRIHRGKLSDQDLEAFWRTCRQLEVLDLTNVSMKGISAWLWGSSVAGMMGQGNNTSSQAGDHMTNEEQTSTFATDTTVRFPKLRELTLSRIHMNSKHQLEQFIVHCPKLQILVWKTRYSEALMERFCRYLAAQKWPYLDWIEIKRRGMCAIDPELALLLQSAPRPLRRADLNIRYFEVQTFDLYRERGHFATLTKVDLTSSPSTSTIPLPGTPITAVVSEQVQEVLESCPMLEHIVALIVNAQDIVQGKPWVCHRLRKFEVIINMEFSDNSRSQEGTRTRIKYSEDDKTLCDQIFERLSQLSQLTALDMRLHQHGWSRPLYIKSSSLPLRLRMGLGRLSTLKNLELIGYYGSHEIRPVDMEWMLQHWKNLRKIAGGPFSVKWSKVPEAAVGEWVRMMKKTLKTRRVQLHHCASYNTVVESMNLRTLYDSGSDSEVDGGSTK